MRNDLHVPRATRISSIDTNPRMSPSRMMTTSGDQLTVADRFAKYATVVTEAYQLHLAEQDPIEARSSWVRLIPDNKSGRVPLSGYDWEVGEVHQVPFDPSVVDLADSARRHAILDWLQDSLLSLAASLHWPTAPLVAAYNACLANGVQLVAAGPAKSSPDRRHRAHVAFEIDGNGDGWSWLIVDSPGGREQSERVDAPPALRAARRSFKSVRWEDSSVVSFQSWITDYTPFGREDWASRRESFTISP
ncbi:MAG: hypothetical protein HOV96_26070 [Nonomuraea sp.]|nr:hypothetical protein [Nonomuraea sp.]